MGAGLEWVGGHEVPGAGPMGSGGGGRPVSGWVAGSWARVGRFMAGWFRGGRRGGRFTGGWFVGGWLVGEQLVLPCSLGRLGWLPGSPSGLSGCLWRLVGLGLGGCWHSTGVLGLVFPGRGGPGACVACFGLASGSCVGVARTVCCADSVLVLARVEFWGCGTSWCGVQGGMVSFARDTSRFHAGGARGFVSGGAVRWHWFARIESKCGVLLYGACGVVVLFACGVICASWCACDLLSASP